MIYEVRFKNGINLDYFGNRAAANKYIGERVLRYGGKYTKEDFEIREKVEPSNNRGVVIPGCDWPTRY